MRCCRCGNTNTSIVVICCAAMIPLFISAGQGRDDGDAAPESAQTLAPPRAGNPPVNEPNTEAEKKSVSKYVLDYTMDAIDGKPVKLESYKGKVLVFVNVASRCGLTPQYEGLEALYRKYRDRGLVVIGFPANDFAGQEPGTDEEILSFCKTNYSVSFPLMSKISVKGKDAHPLYRQLASQPEPVGGEPEWNFDKFVVNRSGEVVARFKPRTTPEDPELVSTIEALLGEEP